MPEDYCGRCGKAVFHAEAMTAGGRKFHKQCFICALCKVHLDSTTVAPHQGEVWCKLCHARKFGPRGAGFGVGAGALHTETEEGLKKRLHR